MMTDDDDDGDESGGDGDGPRKQNIFDGAAQS